MKLGDLLTETLSVDCDDVWENEAPRTPWRWLRRFKHHYNHDRPNQALDGRTPAEEVLN
jgi:putative transposase